MSSTTGTTGNSKMPSLSDLEKLANEMDMLMAAERELNLPIAFLMTGDDFRFMASEHHRVTGLISPPSAFNGIPIYMPNGIEVSVALMRDGTTKPIPRKTT